MDRSRDLVVELEAAQRDGLVTGYQFDDHRGLLCVQHLAAKRELAQISAPASLLPSTATLAGRALENFEAPTDETAAVLRSLCVVRLTKRVYERGSDVDVLGACETLPGLYQQVRAIQDSAP